ncbi:hypothetical protein LOC67_22810 [Stieleria sp. JC731]|uniref:hypothetical protein n=1 Tax=Pirellulaceae TaxID=2691357 RepID=UPI001E5A5A10|nr:hypothetical protein [Stieleria sp. JC731]MCC9603391.1 hypothetical protein [Stieleria sp. JC731]
MKFTVLFSLASLAFVTECASGSPPNAPRIDTVELSENQGWDRDPNVIWCDDFDVSKPLTSKYLEVGDDGGDFAVTDAESLGHSGYSVRARFQKGEVGAGGLKQTFGRNPMDYGGHAVRKGEDFREVYWRHYVKHQNGWVGNPAKLSRATCFAGSDWSQAMIAHIWGGHQRNLAIDPVRGVNSNSQVVTHRYNDFDNFKWLGLKQGKTRVFDSAETGRWVCVEGYVRLNTPGKSDGIFRLYIDGQVEASHENLNWVYSYGEYGINAVFLENYWNSGSPVEQERFFDDFVISTSPIGLAKSPPNPTVWKTEFADADDNDIQSGWELQLATDTRGVDVVWSSGLIEGQGLEVRVDSSRGKFSGSHLGMKSLQPDKVYAARVRQCDRDGNWSSWSRWNNSLRTAPAGDE